MKYVITLILVIFFGCSSNVKEKPIVGIVVPMEHKAMDIIVENFTAHFGNNVSFEIHNAYNDTLLQRSIIQQFVAKNVDLIVPIGTNTTNMALSLSRGIPVLGLAILEEENTQKQYHERNATGLHDEISAQQQFPFLLELFPRLSKMTVVFSASEKVFKEVEAFNELASKNGIEIQQLMINNLSEIYGVSQSIDHDSQLIFIFKDHLVVNGTATLAQTAQKLRIPLISSDEGSVFSGASCALGVREADIGIQGAILAEKILSGTSPKEIPIKHLGELSLFINSKACSEQCLDISSIENLQYEVYRK